MKRILRNTVVILFLFSTLVSSAGVYSGEESPAEVIRVGIYEMPGFHYTDQYGQLQGYCIDYLNLLAGFTGWKYEYVAVRDFSDGCAKLEADEIDLLAPAMYTPVREERFDFSELSFGTEYTVLVTGAGCTTVYYEDYAAFDDMKVAVLEDYPLTDYFIKYMQIHDFESELIYYKTIDESKAALAEGKVDAIVSSIMDVDSTQKVLARFSPQPFYFLTGNEKGTFITQLNKAMSQVENTYPTLLEDLLVEHYPIYEKQYFTREEVEYAQGRKPLRVAYIADRRPLSFTNEAGEFDGISREILDMVARAAGLQFEYVALPEGPITYDFLREERIDLVTGVEYNSTNVHASGMLLSIPYLTSNKMIVSKNGFVYDPEYPYKIAVPQGSQTIRSVLQAAYPNMETVFYKNNMMCFEALAKGEVDLLIQNQYVVEAVLSKPRYRDFIVSPMETMSDELSFSTIISTDGLGGMSESESIRLITILNKSISQLRNKDVDSVIVRETLENQYELDLVDFVYNYRGVFIAGLVAFGFMALFVGSIVQFQMQRKRQEVMEQQRRELQQRRYQMIIDCSNELIFEVGLQEDLHFASDKIREIFGWEIPKKVNEISLSRLMKIMHVHPDDQTSFCKTVIADKPGQSEELTVRLERKDGTYLWCELTRTFLTDEYGDVVSILGKIENVDDEMKARQALEFSSRTDAMTGLLNKITFKNEVKEYLAANTGKNIGFVFIDMDHFKQINDTYGHRVGDIVIRETARKIQLLFANFDLVGRFGGDEFCIFVKDIPRHTFVERLEYAIEKLRDDYDCEGQVIHMSASIGAAYSQKEEVHYKELFEAADHAAYRAKDNGRDCYMIEDIK